MCRRFESAPRHPPVSPKARVIHGKCPEALAGLGKFEVLLTDPPYNSRRKSVFRLPWQADQSRDFGAWDAVAAEDDSWLEAVVANHLADEAALLIFSPLERLGRYEAALESLGCRYRAAIIWHRTNGVVHVPAYKSSCEAIVYASVGKPHFRKWETQKEFAAHNFIRGPSCMGNERKRWGHPTQKPVWLLARLLHRHALPGMRVLDPFCGVGSTLEAAAKAGCESVGVEADPGYAAKAAERLGVACEASATTAA